MRGGDGVIHRRAADGPEPQMGAGMTMEGHLNCENIICRTMSLVLHLVSKWWTTNHFTVSFSHSMHLSAPEEAGLATDIHVMQDSFGGVEWNAGFVEFSTVYTFQVIL